MHPKIYDIPLYICCLQERLNVQMMELPDSAPVVSGIHSVLKLLDEHSLRAVKNLVREGGAKDSKFCEQVPQLKS